MDKTNVLFLAEELRVGGAESYFYKIENNVNRDKYNFYSMAVYGNKCNELKNIQNYYTYSFSPLNRIKRIIKICKEKNISVIHANSLQLAFAAATAKTILRKKRNIRIIYTKHNLTFLEKISRKMYIRFLNKYIDIVNPICDVEKEYLIENGVKSEKIETIYNGTTINDFIFNPNRTHKNGISVGILARLSPEKRHDIYIETAKKIIENFPNVKFYIGGDGPEKESILNKIKECNVEKNVTLLGNVNASKFLSKMDYLMLVSDREVLPMSIIEGMASGCIIIARDIGGVKELVNNDTGYLINSNNPDDYAKKLFDIFNKEFNRDMSYRARSIVEKDFTIENMLRKIEDLYDKLS